MEFELEQLISDLKLPRSVILEDITKGRLAVFQHNEDPCYYVDATIFLDYASTRIGELPLGHQREFWVALKRMLTENPEAYQHLSSQEWEAVLRGLDREISKSSK